MDSAEISVAKWERICYNDREGGDTMSDITKRALEASLKHLLQEKPLEKITINDITEDCGISRMTFYYHFKDIYDLIEWSCDEDAHRLLKGKESYDTWQAGYLRIFQTVQENKTFFLNVYHSLSRELVENYLYKLTFDLLMGVVEEQSAGLQVAKADKAFIANVYKYTLVGLMIEWIQGGMKAEPKEIVERLGLVIHGNVRSALERAAIPG